MSTRKFSNKDINGLESLVTDNPFNKKLLEKIKDELTYRKSRKKNIALAKKIDDLLTKIKSSTLEITFPPFWITEDIFEDTLSNYDFTTTKNVLITFPSGSRMMVNSATKLLSFINQLSNQDVKVNLVFSDGFGGTMGYLYRMNFFKCLSDIVHVSPKLFKRENIRLHGKNKKLVEIEPIIIDEDYNDSLPGRLAHSIVDNAQDLYSVKFFGNNKNKLITAITTLFSELIDNICLHSGTALPGFAVCQIYKTKGKYVAHVAVSDSGLGLLETLRPHLADNYPQKPHYQNLPDNKLVLEIFKTGLSSTSSEAGCGLTTCALQALKFNASVCVRIKDNLIKLVTKDDTYIVDTSYNNNQLTPIIGTSITFEFPLDGLTN